MMDKETAMLNTMQAPGVECAVEERSWRQGIVKLMEKPNGGKGKRGGKVRNWCSQCGQPYRKRACGPTHACAAHLIKQGILKVEKLPTLRYGREGTMKYSTSSDEKDSLLASATDLLNSWAREMAVKEAYDESDIKGVIDRLWNKLSTEMSRPAPREKEQ